MNLHVDVRSSDEGRGFTFEVRELIHGAPAGPSHAFGKGPTKDDAREAAIASTEDVEVRRAIGESADHDE